MGAAPGSKLAWPAREARRGKKCQVRLPGGASVTTLNDNSPGGGVECAALLHAGSSCPLETTRTARRCIDRATYRRIRSWTRSGCALDEDWVHEYQPLRAARASAETKSAVDQPVGVLIRLSRGEFVAVGVRSLILERAARAKLDFLGGRRIGDGELAARKTVVLGSRAQSLARHDVVIDEFHTVCERLGCALPGLAYTFADDDVAVELARTQRAPAKRR